MYAWAKGGCREYLGTEYNYSVEPKKPTAAAVAATLARERRVDAKQFSIVTLVARRNLAESSHNLQPEVLCISDSDDEQQEGSSDGEGDYGGTELASSEPESAVAAPAGIAKKKTDSELAVLKQGLVRHWEKKLEEKWLEEVTDAEDGEPASSGGRGKKRKKKHSNRSRGRARLQSRSPDRFAQLDGVTCSTNMQDRLRRRTARKNEPICKDGNQVPRAGVHLNMMVATWVLGAECNIEELARALGACPWTVVVLVLSASVLGGSELCEFLQGVSSSRIRSRDNFTAGDELYAPVAKEKDVHQISSHIYLVLHRAKVEGLQLNTWSFADHSPPPWRQSGGSGSQTKVCATVALTLDQSRQRCERFVMGIVDLRGKIGYKDRRDVETWIVSERLGFVTGYWANERKVIADIAKNTGATYHCPLFQGVDHPDRSRGKILHPSYFLVFGSYKKVNVVDAFATMPPEWVLGDDIIDEMIPLERLPDWPENVVGSPFVPIMGQIKTKKVDWSRWIRNVYQTCFWIGYSTPSYKSQRDSEALHEEWAKTADEAKAATQTMAKTAVAAKAMPSKAAKKRAKTGVAA
jgi:hypothetical protein